MTADAGKRYTSVAILLHWLIAAGIIGMIALGWIMGDMDRNDPLRTPLYEWHKSIGLSILLLSLARIAWRLMNPAPPEPPMPGWQAKAAGAVHIAFYVLIIAMPLTGWLYSSLARSGGTEFWGLPWTDLPGSSLLQGDARQAIRPQVENVHSKLAWVAIVLLALHVAGALKHQFVDKDGLLARMAPGLFGRTEGPFKPARGGLIAAGIAVLVAGAGLGLGASQGGDVAVALDEPPAAAPSPEVSAAPAWAIDAAQSAIVFKSAYMGRPFEGRFSNWTGDIRFDPDKPETSTVRIVIPTAQVSTGEAYFDENVTEGDWFDSRTHPEAIYEVSAGGILKNSDGSYEATGVLTLKGEAYPLRLPFTLTIDGASAKMHAELTVQRTALGVGRDTLTEEKGDAEWVTDGVSLVIDVAAQRQ